MDKIIDRQIIDDALDAVGIEYNAVNSTYSGRGMYGSKCLSIEMTGKRIQRSLCKFFAELAATLVAEDDEADHSVALQLADAVCTDDLGMDMIVYFPGWRLTGHGE